MRSQHSEIQLNVGGPAGGKKSREAAYRTDPAGGPDVNKMEHLSAYEKVQLARHPQRPYFLDYMERTFADFSEIHGDRKFADDPAIMTGFASFRGRPVCVIGHQKGRDTKQKLY